MCWCFAAFWFFHWLLYKYWPSAHQRTPTLSPQLAHANIPPASSSPFKLTAEKKSATQQGVALRVGESHFSAITCNDV